MADIFGVRVTPEVDTLGSFVICNKPGGQVDSAVTFRGRDHPGDSLYTALDNIGWLNIGQKK